MDRVRTSPASASIERPWQATWIRNFWFTGKGKLRVVKVVLTQMLYALLAVLSMMGAFGVSSYPAFLFDDGEEVGAVGTEAEEALADGVAGGVERVV